jgi:TolB-like protein/tRNA A-37 threonylcarbamoyl transferase component Bud32
MIQHYTDLEKLGEGGMGIVFKARDSRLNRTVVIKALHPDRARDPDPRRRFFQEAQAASALNHPNIVTVYDIGSEDGVDFIVMEYVKGAPMDVLLLQGAMKPDVAVKVSAQIADALNAAHMAGIVHRDLKPGNVVITGTGLVKLLDFGLAKLTESSMSMQQMQANGRESPVTAEGCIVGTAAYMAPEQAIGRPVDARTDIFALGAVMYEMLTGRRAFEGDSAISTLTAVLRDEPADMCLLNREVPQALADVVYRCLKKQPEDRYASAADLKKDLEASLTKPTPRAAHEEPTLAVSAFQNFTTEANDFFAQGLMEELAAALATAPGLRVTSKASRAATAMLEGSIRKSGPRVRVMAQLIESATGQHLWTERYDREIAGDLFKAQEELARSIVIAVRRKLAPVSPLLAEGLAHVRRFTLESVALARDCFERAIREDRDNPCIYSAMADYYTAAAVLGVREPKQLLPKAEWAAKHALEIDPDETGAYAALAVVEAILYSRWENAEDHFARVLQNETHFAPYLFILAPGLRKIPAGVSSAAALAYRSTAEYLAGNGEAAHRSATASLQKQAHFWPATYVQSLCDGDQAPPAGPIWSQGVIARRSPDEARAVVAALAPQRQSRYIPSSLFATAFLTMGQIEKACAAMDRAAVESDPFLPMMLMDPALEPLRYEPRVTAVLQQTGLVRPLGVSGAA